MFLCCIDYWIHLFWFSWCHVQTFFIWFQVWKMSASFTCITCRVAFADAELQRGHYKTDWHRYNLKRKVAELPPVTAENFQQRVLAQRAQVYSNLYTRSPHTFIHHAQTQHQQVFFQQFSCFALIIYWLPLNMYLTCFSSFCKTHSEMILLCSKFCTWHCGGFEMNWNIPAQWLLYIRSELWVVPVRVD